MTFVGMGSEALKLSGSKKTKQNKTTKQTKTKQNKTKTKKCDLNRGLETQFFPCGHKDGSFLKVGHE